MPLTTITKVQDDHYVRIVFCGNGNRELTCFMNSVELLDTIVWAHNEGDQEMVNSWIKAITAGQDDRLI
jgi:hypothetical protein